MLEIFLLYEKYGRKLLARLSARMIGGSLFGASDGLCFTGKAFRIITTKTLHSNRRKRLGQEAFLRGTVQ
ncbi:hypothetical protein ABE38_12320 [Brevibacillus agri]|nr:hypothetical protein [Brevibacillus agri]